MRNPLIYMVFQKKWNLYTSRSFDTIAGRVARASGDRFSAGVMSKEMENKDAAVIG